MRKPDVARWWWLAAPPLAFVLFVTDWRLETPALALAGLAALAPLIA